MEAEGPLSHSQEVTIGPYLIQLYPVHKLTI